ncbi:hypothetical protein [Rubrobacter aplysinae]|uniref:hypothetical protein n=1 Tax=Rubrobacter aplysinae TaxID=909625 RepID=UPI0013649CAD|nr:hypothetical protein [Rubrobacter aplysinae]
MEADIVKEQPPNIGAVVAPYHYPPDTLVLKPTVLNKGDWLRLRIVVENPAHEPNSRLTTSPLYKAAFQSRILGLKRVKRRWDAHRLVAYGFLIVVLGTAVGLVGSLVSALMRFALGRNVALYGIPIDPQNQDPQWAQQVAPLVFNFFQGVELSILLVGVFLFSVGTSKIRKQKKLLRAYRKKSSCIS